MPLPNLLKIRTLLDETEWSAKPLLHLAVLRNITIENIEPFLRHEGLCIDFNTRVAYGNFDQILQEATLPGGPVTKATDAVLVFPNLLALSPPLASSFNQISTQGIEEEVGRIQSYAARAIEGLREKSSAMILWHSFELPIHPANGILDDQLPQSQKQVIEDLNRAIGEILRDYSAAYLVNLDRCRVQIGHDQWMDSRLWHTSRCPYSLQALQVIAHEDFKFIRALKGRNRKMLVLDCDNTLWGGIVGEDGPEGIALGQGFPGSAYRSFQQEVLNLSHRGVLIGLCSKNNPADVWEIFDTHPDMLLRREHISCARINWSNKAENLQDMAAEMNLGLDSFVLVDDNVFEIEMVNQLLPQVETLQLCPEQAEEAAYRLASCGLFDALTRVQEDLNRSAMYQAENRRKQLQSEIGDITEYLCSLEMVVRIARADNMAIPRIAQLTQKTNQFNLTTRRYTEAHIRSFVADSQTDVFYLRLSDRFGDSGIVGTCIIKYEDSKAVVDTFLLSCRVLGREVEHVFLGACLRAAQKRGARQAVGHYLPSPKNQQTSDFYFSAGFQPRENSADATFILDLTNAMPPFPDHFKEITEPLEKEEAT